MTLSRVPRRIDSATIAAASASATSVSLAPAPATYFQLVDYSAISDLPDAEFALKLIRTAGVAAIPVSPFCAHPPPGERLVRLCFAKQDATLVAAAERLTRL